MKRNGWTTAQKLITDGLCRDCGAPIDPEFVSCCRKHGLARRAYATRKNWERRGIMLAIVRPWAPSLDTHAARLALAALPVPKLTLTPVTANPDLLQAPTSVKRFAATASHWRFRLTVGTPGTGSRALDGYVTAHEAPSAGALVAALFSAARGAVDAARGGFAGWCEAVGADPASVAATNAYRRVCRQSEGLIRLFGGAAFLSVIDAPPDLPTAAPATAAEDAPGADDSPAAVGTIPATDSSHGED